MTQTVLITGASSGFGEATAKLFASNGWNVIATMRSPTMGADLASRDNVLVARLDVQDADSIEQAISAGIARFGKIDVLVNNAGYGLFGIFESTPRERIQEQFDVNVFGLMDVTRAMLPHFRGNKGGTIVNISSGGGVFGLPMISLYSASKFAIEGFSESLSYELLSQNIVVKLVEPGGGLSTKFGQRSAAELSPTLTDYDRFVAGAAKVFDGLRAAAERNTSEEVALVIFTAATDGSRKLRYVVGEDITEKVTMRRETSEERYMAMMRSKYMPEL